MRHLIQYSWHCHELPPNVSLDVLVLGSDQKTLSVYHWNHGTVSQIHSITALIYMFMQNLFRSLIRIPLNTLQVCTMWFLEISRIQGNWISLL